MVVKGVREEEDEEEKMGSCGEWKGLLILAKILKLWEYPINGVDEEK